jgi:2-polyprenyl-3-methyl-5-hydroxy-6-metoxy-1,4-benzoquinol methylase
MEAVGQMTQAATDHDCDLCGSSDAAEIVEARHYTNDHPLHVCRGCGFVYVRARRSAEAIAASWSDELFGGVYTARIPAIVARLTFVAEMADMTIGLKGKSVCDIGAGEGAFLDIVRQPRYGASGFGIEPSAANGKLMDRIGIPNVVGTIEDFVASGDMRRFDIATIMWTLENCQSCIGMLRAANAMLKPERHVVIATGSRILVPFKKPLHYYLGANAPDTHAFRFSAKTLERALRLSGFNVEHVNHYVDHDVLCMIAVKTDAKDQRPLPADDADAVLDFFRRWHAETQSFYVNT